MSNTSIVRPFCRRFAQNVKAVASIPAEVARWLVGSSAPSSTVAEDLRISSHQQTLNRIESSPVEAGNLMRDSIVYEVQLNLRNSRSLLGTAERLGYRLEALAHSEWQSEASTYRLSNASGDRLLITDNVGQLAVHEACGSSKTNELLRQHSIDRALDHFAKQGMQVTTSSLPNGELQIVAREARRGQIDGSAEIKTQVRNDGEVVVDVDGIRGSRCVRISRDIASALGGQLSTVKTKTAHIQRSGEAPRVEVGG